MFFLFAFLLNSVDAASQEGYTVMHYTDDNGLPQNSVKSVSGDSEGFIWLTTENGLVRFDGLRFYNFDKSVLGTATSRFLPLQPSLTQDRAKDPEKKLRGKPGKRMYASLGFDHFVRIERGVAKVDSSYFDNTVRKLPYFERGFNVATLSVGLPSWLKQVTEPTRHIIADSYGLGSLYVIDSNAVQFYQGGKRQYQVAFSGYWANYFLRKQSLYYLGEDGKLEKFTRLGTEPVEIAGDLLRDNGYREQFSGLKIYWNIAGDQAYFYSGKNLYLLETEHEGRLYTKLVLKGFDLNKQQIQSVYRDPATQNLFLGSLSAGLYVLVKQPFKTLVPPDDVVDNVFYAQAERDDQVLIMPNGITITRDTLSGKSTFGSLPLLRKINHADKRSLFFDHDLMLWVKVGEKLYKMDHHAEKVVGRWDIKNEIKHIFQDKSRLIWIATGTAGIYTLDPTEPNPRPVKRHVNAKATYFANHGNNILVGTTDGLYIFEPNSYHYKLIEATKGIFIKSVHVDQRGGIWMTANEEGILFYGNNRLSRFPLDKNKYLASPHCIVDDGKGFLWVPTDKGLFQVSVRDLVDYIQSPFPLFYQYHAKDEGFRTNEFNGGCQPCGMKLGSGTVSLPSLMGLVWFKPGDIPVNLPDKLIVLDKTRVNNRIVDVLDDTLILPPDPVQAQFYFSTPYFGNPYNLNLSYALVAPGAQVGAQEWIPLPPTDFSITLSNLNYGTHHLLVRKMNGFGKNNYTIRKMVLIVPPLWYQTWWAKILVIVLVGSCVFLYNRFRLRKISEENAKLEELVARRTARLNDALRDIEGSKNEMSRQVHMLSRLLASMTHDIQSPLNYIRLTSNSIPGMIEKGDLEAVSEIGLVIADSSQRMGDLLRGLLDYIKVYVYGNSLQFQPVKLRDLVNNKFKIFKNGMELNGNEFQNEVNDGLTVLSDEQMLGIMVHNLIDNATKFTHQGVIKVYTEINEQKQVMLMITNSGRGISEDVLEFINAQSDPSNHMMAPYGRDAGLGLLIVKEISEIIQVGLHVKQTDMTCFTLTFLNS